MILAVVPGEFTELIFSNFKLLLDNTNWVLNLGLDVCLCHFNQIQ